MFGNGNVLSGRSNAIGRSFRSNKSVATKFCHQFTFFTCKVDFTFNSDFLKLLKKRNLGCHPLDNGHVTH